MNEKEDSRMASRSDRIRLKKVKKVNLYDAGYTNGFETGYDQFRKDIAAETKKYHACKGREGSLVKRVKTLETEVRHFRKNQYLHNQEIDSYVKQIKDLQRQLSRSGYRK